MSVYFPIQTTYDMCIGSRVGSFHLAWQQRFWDMSTRPFLFTAPMISCGNFYQYPSYSTGMNYLLDPWLAVKQTRWQNMQNPPLFTSGCMCSNAQNLFGSASSLSLTPGYTKLYDKGYTSTETEKDKAEKDRKAKENEEYEDNFNNLYNLLKQIALYRSENDLESNEYKSYVKDLDKIKDDNNKTNKEKYESLKEAYDKIEKNDLKDFIINNQTMLTDSYNSDDISNQASLFSRLNEIGYERETDNDTQLYSKAIETLKQLNKGNIQNYKTEVLNDLVAADVLDVISSINTGLKTTNTMEMLVKIYKKGPNYAPLVSPIIEALCNNLKDAANKYASENSGYTKHSREKLNRAITNLGESNYASNPNLVRDFNTLYTYLRVITAKELSAKMAKTFNELDSDIFTDEMFLSEFGNNTLDDLKKEKMSSDDIKIAKMLGKNTGDRKVTQENDKLLKQRLDEEAFYQKYPFSVDRTETVLETKEDKKKHTVYKEPVTGRMFIFIEENDEKVLCEVTKKDNKEYKVTKKEGKETEKTLCEEILKQIAQKVLYGKNEKVIKEEAEKLFGKKGAISLMMKTGTTDDEWVAFKKAINKSVNANNVLYVLKTANKSIVSSHDGLGGETLYHEFFTELLTEQRDIEEINGVLLKILECMIEASEKVAEKNDITKLKEARDKIISDKKAELSAKELYNTSTKLINLFGI